jgi:tRNA U34 5-methylaminomethyl-2-thiouridine-forming methyltransferase MnmC
MSNQSRLWPTVVGAALASLTVAAAANAQTAPQKPANAQLPNQVITGENDAPKASALARSAAATPSDAQIETQLVQMTSQSTEGLKAVTLTDGSTRVDLEGRFMSVAIATPTSDGGTEVTCNTGKDAVKAIKYSHDVSTGLKPKPKAPAATKASSRAAAEEK